MTKHQSKIEQLISKLCPSGVKFIELSGVVQIRRGVRVVRSQLEETGMYPVYQNSMVPLGYYNKTNNEADTTFIITAGAAGEIGYSNVDFWAADDCFTLIHSGNFQSKFLFHFLKTKQDFLFSRVRRASVPRLSRTVIEKIKIPVPPLAIQEEIVKILNKFTQLEAELEAELEARKKQYNHYRDSLLVSKRIESHIYKLGDIAKNFDSRRKPVTKSAREAGSYPYYGASGIVDYVSDYIFDGNYLLVSEDGANLLARSTPIAFQTNGKVWVNNHAHILEFENKITQRFVEIYLNSIDLSMYISGAAQPKLNQENLNKIEIPLPNTAEQERIVNILDKFDALVSDISIGLPAELNARRQQYEYYRNKLLTFNEYVG